MEREGRGAALGGPGQGCGHHGGWRHTEGPGLFNLSRRSPEERESGEGEGGERGLPLEIQGRGVATMVDGATLKVQGSST